MKINQSNYYETIEQIGLSALSPALKKGHELIEKVTYGNTDWSRYTTFKKVMDLQFEALSAFLGSQTSKTKAPGQTPKPPQITQKAASSTEKEKRTEKPKGSASKRSKTTVPEPTDEVDEADNTNEDETEEDTPERDSETSEEVEWISPEVGFIRRFAAWHNKTKTKEQIGSFIRSLHKAIAERRIRKTSPYAKQINDIQKELIERFNTKGKPKPFVFTEKQLEALRQAGKAQVLYPSIRFIKTFIGLNGKEITKEKAITLHDRIITAIEKERLSKRDRYFKQIEAILSVLAAFVKGKAKSNAPHTLTVSQAQLNGLEGVLKQCGCLNTSPSLPEQSHKRVQGIYTKPLAGLASDENEWRYKGTLMNSMDFAGMHFDTIGFEGKWRELIGDPSKGFTAIVYGKPKFGKSYFCMDWAGYLAQKHGRVLYIAHEEKLDATLQKKVKEMAAKNERLDVSDYLPLDLSGYQYVFVDSISSLRLRPEELLALEDAHPGVSFIYILHVNKLGQARGSNEFVHNVDVVVEIPEKGKAVQFGRFNQGGELEIFSAIVAK